MVGLLLCWLVMVCLICLGCPSRFHLMLLPEEKRGGGLGCCVQEGPACYTLITEPMCTAQMGCTWDMATSQCSSDDYQVGVHGMASIDQDARGEDGLYCCDARVSQNRGNGIEIGGRSVDDCLLVMVCLT